MALRPLGPITALISGLLTLAATPGLANTVTAQSILSQTNALARATALLPAGAVVTGSQCQTVEVGLDNERYLCSVSYTLPAAPPAAGSGQSGGTNP